MLAGTHQPSLKIYKLKKSTNNKKKIYNQQIQNHHHPSHPYQNPSKYSYTRIGYHPNPLERLQLKIVQKNEIAEKEKNIYPMFVREKLKIFQGSTPTPPPLPFKPNKVRIEIEKLQKKSEEQISNEKS